MRGRAPRATRILSAGLKRPLQGGGAKGSKTGIYAMQVPGVDGAWWTTASMVCGQRSVTIGACHLCAGTAHAPRTASGATTVQFCTTVVPRQRTLTVAASRAASGILTAHVGAGDAVGVDHPPCNIDRGSVGGDGGSTAGAAAATGCALGESAPAVTAKDKQRKM